IYGAVYLLSLGLAFGVTIRMRDTVEAPALAAVPVCTDGKFLIELDNEGRKRMMKRYYLRMENSNNKFEGVYKRKKIDIPEIQGIPLGSWVWCLNCYKAGEFRLIVGSQMFPFIVV
ncbi:MAG: hypothetical protein KAS38_07235, partial [Anaerolineales bacterium]|nr:hypothetical protein [Anaerolineales bacterium]